MHLEFGRRYVARKLLGKGGMGVTYKGVDLYKNRDVAIKQMRPEFKNSQKLRSRFAREIREHQKLDHPHIVKILDCKLGDDNPYAIYEFCERGSIGKLAKRGRLDIKDAVRHILDILHGLTYIHSQGLIHRDISPDNVLITRDNVAKISDFGLCLPLERSTTILTGYGEIGGKQVYMPPEQWLRFDKVSAQADIYSLGVTMYFILTNGRLPRFRVCEADSYPEQMLHAYPLVADLDATPSITELNPIAPAVFNKAIWSMLEEDERGRPLSVESISKSLSFLEDFDMDLYERLKSLSQVKEGLFTLRHFFHLIDRYTDYVAIPLSWVRQLPKQRFSQVERNWNPPVLLLWGDYKCEAFSEVIRLDLLTVGKWRRYSTKSTDVKDPLYAAGVKLSKKGKRLSRWLWYSD